MRKSPLPLLGLLALLGAAPGCGGGASATAGTLTAADVDRLEAELEAPTRDEWQQPDEVVRLLELSHGQTVVDLGAGTGYMLPHLSRAVGPDGHVLALEVEPLLVERLRARVEREGLRNVQVRLVRRDDPELGGRSVDRILILDTWPYIEGRPAYARHISNALREDGFALVIDVTEECPHGPPEGMRLIETHAAEELHHGRMHGETVEESLPRQWAVRAVPTR